MRNSDRTRSKLAELATVLKGKTQLLIVMQDNPDPDSIAAAVALRKLANTLAGILNNSEIVEKMAVDVGVI